MRQEKLDQELTELEQSLAKFTPQDASIDAAKVMFAAGHAAAESGRSGNTWWALATAASILMSIGLGIRLWSQPEPRVVYVDTEKSIERESPNPSVAEEPAVLPSHVELAEKEIVPHIDNDTSLIYRRNVAILHGIDNVWPEKSEHRGNPQSPENISRRALEKQFQLRAFDNAS